MKENKIFYHNVEIVQNVINVKIKNNCIDVILDNLRTNRRRVYNGRTKKLRSISWEWSINRFVMRTIRFKRVFGRTRW